MVQQVPGGSGERAGKGVMERFAGRVLDLRTRRGRMLVFGVMPLVAGLITFFTGSLSPVSAEIVVLVSAYFAGGPIRHEQRFVIPPNEAVRRDGAAGWWNRRRRFGFYAAFSVLLMFALTFARSAVTDTWGSGDLMLAILLLIPLFVIFRPPRPTASAGRGGTSQ